MKKITTTLLLGFFCSSISFGQKLNEIDDSLLQLFITSLQSIQFDDIAALTKAQIAPFRRVQKSHAGVAHTQDKGCNEIPACVKAINENPDELHLNYTPVVYNLSECGLEAAMAVITLLQNDNFEE